MLRNESRHRGRSLALGSRSSRADRLGRNTPQKHVARARNHPAGDLALSPGYPELSRRRRFVGGTGHLPCQVCGEVKLCVPNDKVGLPDKFLTADDALKLIAENMMEWTKGEKGH